ncbi:unnamed protein product [Protopolystoma xenopodis]|uniref:Uncharacterized protein n=1 Tax=Protopolystoma xenopodis TaxID=117903 RepID=A0A3S5BA65_9PLAT|nr:unnamed protein product [Protopolystoma xenopodis]
MLILAYLDLPESGTFDGSTLLLLLIFYLQHTKPPVLPNLHDLTRKHMPYLPNNLIREVSFLTLYLPCRTYK